MQWLDLLVRRFSSVSPNRIAKVCEQEMSNGRKVIEEGMMEFMSKRKKERKTKLDQSVYEYLKRRMIGRVPREFQRGIEEKRKYAPIFLDQIKPRMDLYKTAIQVDELPLPKYPEVAFIGRSNCGKSTLINELVGRTNKAKVSKKAGCTQKIHFYKVGSPPLLCLVDLPGYGYAEAREELRLQWNEFTLFYLKNRTNLKKVFLLIDCRAGLKNSDKELMHFFGRYNIKYQLVITKCDLVQTKELAIKLQLIQQELTNFRGGGSVNKTMEIIPLSSLKKQNLQELRNEIARYQLNKTIVKNNIKMKISDLIEQRRLRKLKLRQSKENYTEEEQKEGIKNDKKTQSEYRDILLNDETIENALHRWDIKNRMNLLQDKKDYLPLANAPNEYVRKMIVEFLQHFMNHCMEEYDERDMCIIDSLFDETNNTVQEENTVFSDNNSVIDNCLHMPYNNTVIESLPFEKKSISGELVEMNLGDTPVLQETDCLNENNKKEEEIINMEEMVPTVEKDKSSFQCKEVHMDALFQNSESRNDTKFYFKKKEYSQKKHSVLLDEEDTYSREDYLKGIKSSKNGSVNRSLHDFVFDRNDARTHRIYEDTKSLAYQTYKSNQLMSLVQEELEESEKKNETKKEKKETEKQKDQTTKISSYIGLKTRKYMLKGTKKLKLFGKKKSKEITMVPKDLATTYFRLSEPFYVNKKKRDWNYIHSKYNKWINKIKRKRGVEEITEQITKKDVMIRYVEKEKSKFMKQQNKLLRQNKNIGMLTKPHSKNKIKRISRNYSLSDDQKIIDKEAFFKYRDVQKGGTNKK